MMARRRLSVALVVLVLLGERRHGSLAVKRARWSRSARAKLSSVDGNNKGRM